MPWERLGSPWTTFTTGAAVVGDRDGVNGGWGVCVEGKKSFLQSPAAGFMGGTQWLSQMFPKRVAQTAWNEGLAWA